MVDSVLYSLFLMKTRLTFKSGQPCYIFSLSLALPLSVTVLTWILYQYQILTGQNVCLLTCRVVLHFVLHFSYQTLWVFFNTTYRMEIFRYLKLYHSRSGVLRMLRRIFYQKVSFTWSSHLCLFALQEIVHVWSKKKVKRSWAIFGNID